MKMMALANKYIIFSIHKIILHEQCNIVLQNVQILVRRVCVFVFGSEKHFLYAMQSGITTLLHKYTLLNRPVSM